MKYFELLIAALFIGASIGWFWHFGRRLRRDHYGKILTRAILQRQQNLPGRSLFITPVICQMVTRLLRQSGKTARHLLDELITGHSEPMLDWLHKHRQSDAVTTLRIMLGETIELPTTDLQEALVYFNHNQLDEALKIAEAKQTQKPNRYEQGLIDYLQSWGDMRDGDLLSASTHAAAAAKRFRQSLAYYEEAQTMVLMGTIYRVSALSDVAQLMLRSARKLFQNLQATKEEAETLGHLGMLMVTDNRQEEAESNFAEALKLYREIGQLQGEAEIINQQALAKLIFGEADTALSWAELAQKIHLAIANPAGLALSHEIIARAASELKQWEKALRAANLATELYEQQHNSAGELETTMIAAQALMKQGELNDAEKLLRKVIAETRETQSCFHVANAYNQLGIIYLQQGELQRAKGLFQQSLDCELANNRTDGIAIDYANLALIEYRLGQKEQGDKTVRTALEFAKAYGESDLSQLLESRLSNNQVQS